MQTHYTLFFHFFPLLHTYLFNMEKLLLYIAALLMEIRWSSVTRGECTEHGGMF